MLIFVTGIPRSANADGYSWTRWENTAYFALGTTGYLTSVLAFMFIIFFGYGNAMKKVLSSRVWNSLSKIGLGCYLVYPMIITLGFVGTNTSFFISYPSMVYAFVTNIVISFLAGFVLHMVVQAPANGLIRVTKKLIIGERMQTLEKFNLASSEKPPVVQKEEEKKLLATIEQENDDFLTNSQFKLKTKQDV